MGKNKAARKAAELAAKAAKKETVKPVDNTEAKPEVTTKPEDKPADKPAEKPVEKKEEKPQAKPQVEKPKPAPKGNKTQAKPTSKEAPLVEAEEVDGVLQKKEKTLGTVFAGAANGIATSSRMSPDAKANLAYAIHKRYCENADLAQQNPALCAAMGENFDVVSVLALLDLRKEIFEREQSGEFKIVGSPEAILHLREACAVIGIELTPLKALPAPGNDGQQSFDFKEETIPAEMKPMTREEAGIAPANAPEYVPELDPTRITTDEQLKDALTYQMTKSSEKRNVAESIFNTVEWYSNYCIFKETDEAKKAALKDLTITNWLDKIFGLISPTVLVRGLGSSLYMYCSQTGSPIMAHSILYRYLNPKGWNEEQIAEVLKVLIKQNFQLKRNDKPELQAQDDKAILALLSSKGADYVDSILSNQGSGEENKVNRMLYSNVRSAYWSKDDKVTNDMIRMKIGQILNVYRDPLDRIEEFAQDVITPTIGEYPAAAPATDEKKN